MDKGHLLIAGGGMSSCKKDILRALLENVAGKPRICVIVAASLFPVESYNAVKETFLEIGAEESNITILPVSQENIEGFEQYGHSGVLPLLEDVNIVWITGGDQLKLTKCLLDSHGNDSPVMSRIREILGIGGIVGGSSAGAAIMSEKMISRGGDKGSLLYHIETDYSKYKDIYEEDNELEKLLVTKGLGFFENVIVDQHFNKRARLQRLMKVMEFTGIKKGYGVSENTAMLVSLETKTYEVIGSDYVMEVDMISKDNYQIKKIYQRRK